MQINYQATVTGAKFHKSEKVVRCLKGCVGSGKTVACINELHRLSVEQWPNCDGIRKTRWAIVRNTTPELRTTTLNTFKQWIPEQLCPITMNPMIMGHLKYVLKDGTRVSAEFIFLALDNPKDVRKLLGIEVTGVYCNEARELDYSVVKAARERIGRYPSVIDGYGEVKGEWKPYIPHYNKDRSNKACRRKCVIMDTNPPDDDHWWYQLDANGYLEGTAEEHKDFAISETDRVFEFFNTPAPLIKNDDGTYSESADAENIRFLPGGYQYYFDMIAGNTEDHVNVMVLGNYGAIRDGKPVYPQYNDTLHCPAAVPAIKGLPLGLGWDFGLTPACVITQMTATGQLRIVKELFVEDMDIRQFAKDVVRPILASEFKGFEIAFSLADPSGVAGEGEGRSAIGILNDVSPDDGHYIEKIGLGFITEPAPTNDPTKRIDAVSGFLKKLVDGGRPGYVIDKRCKILRKGKQGKYQYRRIQAGGEQRYKEAPNKDKYSHPADAEQYAALGWIYGYEVQQDEYDDWDYQEKNSVTGY
jgi:hypothetical protein